MVAAALDQADIGFDALDGVAVTCGPGTFTGVRVGLSAARAYGLALKIPVLAVGTLAAMAQPALDGVHPVLVVVDARRDTFYTQAFAANGQAQDPPQALSSAALATMAGAGAQPWRVVGSGRAAVLAVCTTARAARTPDWPQAAYVAALGRQQWADGAGTGDPTPPVPIYLRPPDATLPDPAKALRKARDPS